MKKVFIASGLALLLFDGMLVNCNAQCTDVTYPDQAESPYILPYQVGKTFAVGQGNCGTVSHNKEGTQDQRFAYDFDLPMDEPVIAARAGTITFIEKDAKDNECTESDDPACHQSCVDKPGTCQPTCADQENCPGNTVMIKHDDNEDGIYARYDHLRYNSVKLTVGEHVSKGQVIAKSGNSGESDSPHLHFEVYNIEETSLPIRFSNSKPKDDNAGGLQQILDKPGENSCAGPSDPKGCYEAEPFHSPHSPTAINSLLLSPNN